MPGIYGGDDVSAIVVDPGSSQLRGGWAGEDTPRTVIPSSYGWVEDDSELATYAEAIASAPSTAAEGSNGVASTGAADGDVSMTDGNAAAGTTSTSDDPTQQQQQQQQQPPNLEVQDKRTRIARYMTKKLSGPNAKGKKRYFGDSGVNQWRRGMEISPTVVDGVVTSAPDLLQMINYTYDSLSADSTEHPLLLTEPAWTSRETREELTEMAFEGLGVPAYYLANSTVLSSFSAGKPSSLILDVGYSSVSAIPVVDGFIIRKGIFRQDYSGGAAVSRALLHDFQSPPPRTPRLGGPITELVPTYRVKNKKATEAGKEAQWQEREDRREGTTDSYKQYHQEKLLHEAKESLGQVFDQPWNEQQALQRPSRPFEFPNGYNDVFGIERLRASEVLFEPSIWAGVDGILAQSGSVNPAPPPSVPQMVLDAISSVDVDHRPALLSNIVCVGGGTFLPGFVDRLSYELTTRAPAQKIKIHSPGNSIERRHSAWLGGSILASLGSFHQMWVSKQEYEEHGAAIVHARAR